MNEQQLVSLGTYIDNNVIDNTTGRITPLVFRSVMRKEEGGLDIDGVMDFFAQGSYVEVQDESGLPKCSLGGFPDFSTLYYAREEKTFWMYSPDADDLVQLQIPAVRSYRALNPSLTSSDGAVVWQVQHNINGLCVLSVTCADENTHWSQGEGLERGEEVRCKVVHNSENAATLTFATPSDMDAGSLQVYIISVQ